MCREESAPYLDSVADPEGEVANPQKPKFTVGGVVVHGNAASATLTFPDHKTQTMYFRKEDGKWNRLRTRQEPAIAGLQRNSRWSPMTNRH
jgi:hypothetical protein